jgi:hypothetical protein
MIFSTIKDWAAAIPVQQSRKESSWIFISAVL